MYSNTKYYMTPLTVIRLAILLLAASMVYYHQLVQSGIDVLWEFVKERWIFNLVYFETLYVTMLFTFQLCVPAYLDLYKGLDIFKIDPNTAFEHPTMTQVIIESIIYMAPLAILDTVMVKWYSGVPESIILEKRKHWLQSTRALPQDSPPLFELVWHVAVALLIFDLIFFVIHLTLHRNTWLFKNVHADHHHHKEGLHGRITNKLTVVERVTLVLSANLSLKVLGAHPLTRIVYVPIFLWLLIENHWGYDFPVSVDKIVPFGLMGGSVHHYKHHMEGSKNYGPFFTHIDRMYHWWNSRSKGFDIRDKVE